jgi:hypothetical protein
MTGRDGQTVNAAIRQAQLEAKHRDLTKPQPVIGTTNESIRTVQGFEGISDEILNERATFNLKDHMQGIRRPQTSNSVDLTKMTPEELRGLAQAAETQAKLKEKP